ncbi:hypothetical protein P154DRAFT_518288 [Amniculicola lignicola CBS 123094]|uniref:Uncharacterized protein n=1 Tax=Amniculicola lignicola CBS 123094 TaxID=1392246 RepID=A0A6A5WWT5_9PLEO|nr:hypothetical protein P154DRAFT_518288 [Amniculicola lignicola CBS 123094]
MELSERFVRLSGPTGEEIRRLLNLPDMFALWVENGMDRDSSFWKIDWKKDPDPNAETFLCFLLGADWAGRHLAPAFANRHSMLPVLTAQLRFTMEFDVYDTHDRTCEFIGSIPELVAQQSPLHPDIFDLILDLISDQGTAHFDLSKILLLCVGNHRHRNCKTSCPLERLLDFGASANGPEGACMTPLQIATSCWDICGVKTLLTAGADVDATRNDGLRFPPDSVMGERFNRFFGLTPLDIIRYSDWKYMEEIKREVLRKEIEGLLLQFGAKGNESHDEEVIFRRRMVGVRQKIRI